MAQDSHGAGPWLDVPNSEFSVTSFSFSSRAGIGHCYEWHFLLGLQLRFEHFQEWVIEVSVLANGDKPNNGTVTFKWTQKTKDCDKNYLNYHPVSKIADERKKIKPGGNVQADSQHGKCCDRFQTYIGTKEGKSQKITFDLGKGDKYKARMTDTTIQKRRLQSQERTWVLQYGTENQ